ncbi:chromate efflux transporter [Alkaliphilus peptidifermentans]|uniref:Chromate transporter n=1 Tax=Alkaliphilus peptidifermentans DSM 18978 TaxID=1120976 RepID=A0A1G5KRG8_9FIRM|nr:chromate efflux transporter [Alkaliphilus peptidifermentans]SCZ03263.1 chromate transporter [Alkaliphilus peptidifermentans DSM 18978]
MKEIILYFLKIGLLGFGGPMAHIAMMDNELVEKRKWATKEEFLDGLAVCNMLPGPASTQLGIYMGFIRGGIKGGILAGIAFILPAFLLITLLSYLYFNYGAIPQVKGILYGVNAVVIALIGSSLYKMSKKSIADIKGILILGSSTIAVYLLNVNLVIVLITGGILGVFIYYKWQKAKKYYMMVIPLFLADTIVIKLFGFFLKVGSFIYGGGLVIIPFIEQEVVERLGWMTQQEFLTGISFGQITPGPVVITSAFIGYKVYGLLGAFIAAFAIFLPSFALILIAAPYLNRVKNITWIKAFLKGTNAAVIGSVLASILALIPNALTDIWTILIALGGFVALWRFKVNALYCVGAAGALGIIITNLI